MKEYKRMETERLILRTSNEEDAAFVLELLNTPMWLKYIGDRHVTNIDLAQEYIKARMMTISGKSSINFTVMLKQGNVKIGSCGIFAREGFDCMDIGFSLLPKYMKQGYAFESAKRVLEYAFKDLDVNKICGYTTEDNINSQQLLKKLGLVYEKMMKLPKDDADLMQFTLQRPSNS